LIEDFNQPPGCFYQESTALRFACHPFQCLKLVWQSLFYIREMGI